MKKRNEKKKKKLPDLAPQLVHLVGEALPSCAGSGEAFQHALLPERVVFGGSFFSGKEREREGETRKRAMVISRDCRPPIDVVERDREATPIPPLLFLSYRASVQAPPSLLMASRRV